MSGREEEISSSDEMEDPILRKEARLSLQEKLKLIAHVLEVPVSTFEEQAEKAYFSTRTTANLASEAECTALLSAFRQIVDPDVRRRYLALLQSVAASS